MLLHPLPGSLHHFSLESDELLPFLFSQINFRTREVNVYRIPYYTVVLGRRARSRLFDQLGLLPPSLRWPGVYPPHYCSR